MLVYHASKHNYDFPDYEKIIANRDNHLNGHLGLWVATNNQWISGFGSSIYEVEIDDKDIIILPVDDLFEWEDRFKKNMSEDYYINLRNELIKTHKVIMFQESRGSIDMGIVLDFDYIKSFTLINPEPSTNPQQKLKI